MTEGKKKQEEEEEEEERKKEEEEIEGKEVKRKEIGYFTPSQP